MAVVRPASLVVGQRKLPVPVYFPSISSVKTTLRPIDYLQVLSSLVGVNGQFLVSAFDLAAIGDSDMVVQMLRVARDTGAITLMDSGNYKSFWKDAQGCWTQAAFHKVLGTYSFDLAFGFDQQQPPDDFSEHVALVVARWREDQAAAGDCLIVPIVHGTAETLPDLCAQIAQDTLVPIIAVAERRLGEGIFERTRSVAALRESLDRTGRYVGLHLLGTGNPMSIALYSWAGADSFDGLEWCQTVVDHDSGLLFHLSQSDFFRQQTSWGTQDISFQARTLAHNLMFYADWMQSLRQAVHAGDVVNFCRFNFPLRIFRQCSATFDWEDLA